jgi:hypothetical protein
MKMRFGVSGWTPTFPPKVNPWSNGFNQPSTAS